MRNVVHLDDHLLFSKGVRQILKDHFSDFLFTTFQDNESALEYITESFKNNVKIDLIITDFNHQRGTGLDFAKKVREMEPKNSSHIPIMLLTMCGMSLTISNAIEYGIFDAYFPKSAEAVEILDFITKVTG